MANTSFVPVEYILQRGQTVKNFSLLVKSMHGRGMICPDEWRLNEGETEADAETRARTDGEGADQKAGTKGYTGAVVLEPRTGAWFTPVATLDYASLVT